MTEPAPYTTEWWDKLHERKDRIEDKVTALVNKETADLTPVMDEQLRLMLTETYRFWR